MNKAQLRIKKGKRLSYLKSKVGKLRFQIKKSKRDLRIAIKEIKTLKKELRWME